MNGSPFSIIPRKIGYWILELLITRKERKLKLLEANTNALKYKLGPSITTGEYKEKIKHLQDCGKTR